jgi:hypothetical protein
VPEREARDAADMKGIILRTAIIVLGIVAYIGIGMALASSG